jgi:hypothetical protein
MSKAAYRTTVTAVALFAAVSSAEAAMRTTGTYGAWTASEGLSAEGTPMCNAGLLGADRTFYVKAFSDHFQLQTFKDGWNIPVNQLIDVTLQVDSAPPMDFVGYGMEVPHDATFGGFFIGILPDDVWAHTGRKTITELTNLLKNGHKFRLTFPDGDERPWEGSLAGSTKALNTMMDCARRLIATQPTQPFGKRATPAQALGPAPSQPFGVVPRALPQEFEAESSLGPAVAADRLPQAFIGNWCTKGDGTYSVGSCSDRWSDGMLTVRSDGFEAHEEFCKVVKVIREREQYVASFRCSGEGEEWSAQYRMSLQIKGKSKYLKMVSK